MVQEELSQVKFGSFGDVLTLIIVILYKVLCFITFSQQEYKSDFGNINLKVYQAKINKLGGRLQCAYIINLISCIYCQ
jgi:hypothetical protein